MSVRSTEREVSEWLVGEINTVLQKGGFPFKEATGEVSLVGKGSLFPDVVLWLSREAGEAFTFWEIKPPGDREDLSKLPKKARRLRVSYALTWNFQEAVLYEVKGESLIPLRRRPEVVMSSLEEWKREDVRAKLRSVIQLFLEDFKTIYEKGHLHEFLPDKVFFVSLLRESVDKLYGYFSPYLKERVSKNRKLKEQIDAWALEQGIRNVGGKEFYDTLSRQRVYSLITKILFYLTLRRKFRELPDLSYDPHSPIPFSKFLKEAFQCAQGIDWYAIFQESLIEQLGIPPEAEEVLIDLLEKLKEYHFGHLREDVIGEVFEELIPPEERHNLGQYFTREDLVDFIVGFVVGDTEGFHGDPTCGSGTFLNRIYSRLRWLSGYRKSHEELLSQIWGVDIAPFPAALAMVNLFRQDVSSLRNFPRVLSKDFFEICPGEICEFPPMKAPVGDFRKVKVPFPNFRGMVGNFPYIRQELIERKKKGYKTFLTKVLARDWLLEFPEVFSIRRIRKEEIAHLKILSPEDQERQIDAWVEQGLIDLKLSGQADIYAYLFLHAARFMEEGGRMGFITSNSWLDVAYGKDLKRFFLEKFKIIAIVGSWAEPWFEDPKVNPVFTILERCENEKERAEHIVKFVKLKRPLKELLPYQNLGLQEPQRWARVDSLVRGIEIAEASLREFSGKHWKDTLRGVRSLEDESYRIRMVRQEELRGELEEKGELAKWGKYLRAPDVYFEILEQAKDWLVPLGEVTEIRRGYTTGINEFFYLEPTGEPASRPGCLRVRNDRGWEGEIEEEFLKPVIKSPKESESIVIDPVRLRYRLFLCPLSKEELKQAGKIGALHYIGWGETQRTQEGTPWSQVSTVKNRRFWWDLGSTQYPDILWLKAFDDRFIVFLNSDGVLSSDRMYEITVLKPELKDILGAVLNTTLAALFIEINSRVNLGDGALDNMVYEAQKCPVVNPSCIFPEHRRKILSAFQKLKVRPIGSIFEEVNQKDRRKLDQIVLEAIGLDPKVFLPRIYQGLTELVRERLELPKMRKRQRIQTTKRSVAQIKKLIEEDILPDGLRPFPEGFVDEKTLREGEKIPVSGKPLRVGEYFLGLYEVVDEDGQKICDAKGLAQAKFLVFSYKPHHFLLSLPRDPIVVEKAVERYERYIKTIYHKLVERAFRATFDHSQAERIAQDILQEYGVSREIFLSRR